MDAFRFTGLNGGIDTITDFKSGTDKIQIDSNGFTGLAIGQLSAEAFTSGAGVTSATSSTHRFIFNTTNGDLFFDADGDGAGASVKIATLSNSASLSHSDIFVNINVTGNDLNNVLLGNDDNNVLDGDSGNDNLSGQGGNDTLIGGEGNDTLIGGTGADSLIGGNGNDTYVVDDLGDVVIENANEGIDTVISSISYHLGDHLESLSLIGENNINGAGNDLNNAMLGNNGNNFLDGGLGDDNLSGEAGNDTLIGGEGNDTLTGGVGMDAFRFTGLDGGIDTITDFESGTDKIQIDSNGFTSLAIGQLSAEAFTFGAGVTSATSSTHRFIFNTTNGDLFFDADGDGAGASVKIATLSNSASLSHSDIFVI
ncbi:calcium-binding protein [Sphaerospermopsis sp. FACHB-1094]|nr:calcium-binding protein [Sphaerospermopsis sp. FACHB-1094]